MVSKTVLLLWCLVVSVCWMSETEAWSGLNSNTMKGKRSITKVRLLLGYLSTYAPLIFLYFSVDMKSNNSYLYASISKALLPINPNLHDKSSTFFLLTSISLFVFCLFVCLFFQDLRYPQRNIRNLCASMKDLCKPKADEWSSETD